MCYGSTMMNPMQEITINAQIKKGILDYATLLIIARGKAYASDILKALKDADLIVAEGTLYPLLSRLHIAGLLGYTWSESPTGPPRKYYTLTPAGISLLENLKQSWLHLTQSITTLSKQYESDR